MGRIPNRQLPADLEVGHHLQLVCACERKLGIYTIVRISGGRKMAWATTPAKEWERIVRAHDIRDDGSHVEHFVRIKSTEANHG